MLLSAAHESPRLAARVKRHARASHLDDRVDDEEDDEEDDVDGIIVIDDVIATRIARRRRDRRREVWTNRVALFQRATP